MRRLAIVSVFCAILVMPLVSSATPAFAVACSGSTSAPFWLWTRSALDVYGVRAPIQARRDGGLCGSRADDPFTAAWIGIQQESGSGITQIGYEKDFDSNSVGRWCRFWAIGTGFPHDYGCNTDANDTFMYFKVVRYYDTPTRTYRYNVDDCGTGGGYGSCTNKSSSQAAYGNPEGIVSAETDYGCVVHIMGSGTDRQNYGTSSYPVQGMDSTSWTTRSWGVHDAGCTSYYMRDQGPDGMRTWDTRNSG